MLAFLSCKKIFLSITSLQLLLYPNRLQKSTLFWSIYAQIMSHILGILCHIKQTYHNTFYGPKQDHTMVHHKHTPIHYTFSEHSMLPILDL